ncbi:PP2C family protein-serine/threonine phosphatase [Paracoccus seriniphilus]|uniref:PP2C family protein-serine/threonine phosphatase n=1 Tax=Paracoccus seriniphilus TaxID=184748 RepID=UPI0023EA4DE6|nr:SpoIIE family protein phosphatase [Paracoccus seriniphilus]WCR16247.1 SpoIIE family protein phosphatase [Paracoccus seriniphilus]
MREERVEYKGLTDAPIQGSACPTVIVADDDAVQRTYTSAVLRKLGYEPLEAEDGLKALDLVRKIGSQLLICDLDMPGLDGHQLARQVRQENRDRYVHILMVTGRDQRREREKALESGVDDFMAKPLDTASLTARVRSVSRLLRHEQLLAERNEAISRAKEQIEDDIRAAATAQRRLLPVAHAEVADCAFHSAFVPSNILSGDMYSYYELAPGLTAFYAVDVAGHGVNAALLSVALGHLLTAEHFRQQVVDTDGNINPARLVHSLNARFFDQSSNDYFTMFCGVLDHQANVLHYCQAGYPSPVLAQRSGECHLIGEGGFPVALVAGMEFESHRIDFRPGQALVLVSDGAHEAENLEGEPFDDERVIATIRQRAADPSAIPDNLVQALTQWRQGATLDDDLSVLVCERRLKE